MVFMAETNEEHKKRMKPDQELRKEIENTFARFKVICNCIKEGERQQTLEEVEKLEVTTLCLKCFTRWNGKINYCEKCNIRFEGDYPKCEWYIHLEDIQKLKEEKNRKYA